MRAAPPVSVRCVDGGAWRAFSSAVPALGVGVAVYWGCALAGMPQRPAGMAAAIGLAGACAAAAGLLTWVRHAGAGRVRHGGARVRELQWDGQRWTLDGVDGAPEVVIDLDRWMLLRFRCAGAQGASWLALSAAQGSATWHALRAALYSPPPEDTATAAKRRTGLPTP